MRVAICQSNYLAWKGYFDLIHDAEMFIFHDDLQYTKNDWRNRNRIKTDHGTIWLTIPVGSQEHRLINQVVLPAGADWRQKHWRRILQSYEEAPEFRRYAEFFRDVYSSDRWPTLSGFNQYLITNISREFLGIRTQFADSASFKLMSKKQDRVIDLLKAVGATTYISGPSAKSYLEPTRFEGEGIELIWKDYSGYPEYSQRFSPFEHAVSIIDLLFSVGPKSQNYIWGWRNAAKSI